MNDPQLKRVLYGVDYSPHNVQYPNCGASQKQVTMDIAVLSQITSRIRLYGTDCDQAILVLNAIQDLNVDLTISLGVWVDALEEVSNRQLADMRNILRNYPDTLIDSILIGNEVLFRDDMSMDQLISHIEDTRNFLAEEGLSIPIGTSEIGSKWKKELAAHVDLVAANIHPFFGGVRVEDSTKWTYQFLLDQVVPEILAPDHHPRIFISEVGWPSGGGFLQGSVAGINQLQYFLNDWVCHSRDDIGWYWFEAFDEPWKEIYYSATQQWETQWGLFDSNRKLKKGIQFPNCESIN